MITLNVGSAGGRDYATVTAAWAAIPGTLADSYTILLYDDTGGTGYTEQWNLTDRNTSNGAFTILIKAAAGHSFYDNATKANNALRFNPANGVAFTALPFNDVGFAFNCPDITLDGIQFSPNGQSTNSAFVFGKRRCVMKNCIVRVTGNVPNNAVVETTYNTTFINNLIYAQGNASVIMQLAGSFNAGIDDELRNCTIYLAGTLGGYYMMSGPGSPHSQTVYNTCIFAPGNVPDTGSGFAYSTGTGSNNVTDTASFVFGTSNLTHKAASAQFVSLTPFSEDFRAISGADIAGAGFRDNTNTADLDILKAARSTTAPTVGAHERVASVQVSYYPGSDISAGNWTPSTGATLFGTIDETTRDDSDYDQSGLNPTADIMEVKFAGVSSPGTTSNHVVTYVIWASGTLNMTVSLVCGTTVIRTWTHSAVAPNPTQFDQTLLSSEAALITNYSDLRLRVQAG